MQVNSNQTSIQLNPDEMVALWRKDASHNIKPKELQRMINPVFRGWYCCAQTSLDSAMASWQWSQENLGKTFPDSIYVVSEVWIFPLDFEVSPTWLEDEQT